VDARLDENQAELAVNVLAVTFQMLANADGLLDEEVQILWDVGLESNGLHDAEHLVAVDETHLSDSVRVTKNDAYKCSLLISLCTNIQCAGGTHQSVMESFPSFPTS